MKKLTLMLLLLPFLGPAQQKQDMETRLLMDGKAPAGFLQQLPDVQWTGGNTLLITENQPGDNGENRQYILDVATGKTTAPGPASSTPAPAIVVKNNDLYLKKGEQETRLTHDAAEKKNPVFSPDSSYIAYTKNNDLYTFSLAAGKETRLTHDGTTTIRNGYATWVYWEEIFGRPTQFRAFWWSPDSRKIAYMRFDESKTPMFPLAYSQGQHGFVEETRYPKSGDPNPTARIGFISPDGGNTVWADFNEQDDQYFGWPKWRSDGAGLLVQWINRGNDHLKLYQVSPATGAKKEIYTETQNTWINIDEADDRLTLLEESGEMIISSDKSGWQQLYLYTTDGRFKNKITDGRFTVTSVTGIDPKSRIVYFQARGIENTARYDLYRVGFDGKGLKRLTFGDYSHRQVIAAPGLRYFVTTYSNLRTPPQMAVIDNQGKQVRLLGNARGTHFDRYRVAATELIRVKSDDGRYELPLVITYPENMEAGKKYPVLISIYGGPNAGTVYDQWNWSPTRQLYAREGLIQVSLDHRASGHFGKEGLNFLHRNLGYWEMKDYITQVKHLIGKGLADPGRIGITGFSYGGYLTCYALTYGSHIFTHGMAGGSVTDWKYYDSAYTERFMDTPSENPEGYTSSSVLTHVPKYRGVLQIVHGDMDDNVHLQNSLRLISDLQDAGKEFDFMLYPGARHGWGGAKGIHYQNLKTGFIYKHLLKKPVPEGLLK